jgi:uncharacterized protein YuzE
MKITYSWESNAGYIYFTSIAPGGVVETIVYQPLEVDLDNNEQIVVMRLIESEEFVFSKRLKYALQHDEVTYEPDNHMLRIAFAPDSIAKRSISWDAHIDLDRDGQILGLEILFGYAPLDSTDTLQAGGRLQYISKYLVGFNKVV